MNETTIPLSNPEQARILVGPRDENLRLLRQETGVDLVVRGEQLKLIGDRESLELAEKVVRDLLDVASRTRSLGRRDVKRALGLDAGDSSGPLSLHDQGRQVEPRTPGQAAYVQAIRTSELVFCTGPAGSGKTYLAVAMAIHALRTDNVRKIVLVRPAVEAGEKLGYLPGDMLAKVNPFLRPLLDALNDILGYDQVHRYMDHDVIEIVPLAFMRGRTLNETFIILDEAQNTTITQMKMFLTRMGIGSKIVVTGDATQVDLANNVTSGLTDAIRRLGRVDGVEVVALAGQDIVRHPLVRQIVKAYDEKDTKLLESPDQPSAD